MDAQISHLEKLRRVDPKSVELAKRLADPASHWGADHELIAVFAESFNELANIHHTYKDRTPAA